MSVLAFNGGLSYVFLESALRPSYANLGLNPADIWAEARKQSSVKPFFESSDVEVAKTSGALLKVGRDMDITLRPTTVDDSFPVLTASFQDAADAETFYNELNHQLEKAGIQHALRETARLNEGGKSRIVGFQI